MLKNPPKIACKAFKGMIGINTRQSTLKRLYGKIDSIQEKLAFLTQ